MTASNVAATERITHTFLAEAFPWVPLPAIIEWDNTAGGSMYYATAQTIAVPKYSDQWNDEDRTVKIHECGHVVVFYSAQFGGDVVGAFLNVFGADPQLRQCRDIQEIIAEHFARAYVDGYDGRNRPELVGLVRFDTAAARAFFEGLRAVKIAATPVSGGVIVPQIEWVGPAAVTNFAPGRQGNPMSVIVDHWTAGSYESALARFRTPVADPRQAASAHYIVRSDGRVAQVVLDEDTAYHAGAFSVNLVSIGIEHEASPTLPPTPALYAASSWLHARLAEKHGFDLIVGVTVRPHRDIVPTACPGTLDLNRIVEGVEDLMFTEEDRDRQKRILELLEAREGLVWITRQQRGLDVERGRPFDASQPPIDQRVEVK